MKICNSWRFRLLHLSSKGGNEKRLKQVKMRCKLISLIFVFSLTAAVFLSFYIAYFFDLRKNTLSFGASVVPRGMRLSSPVQKCRCSILSHYVRNPRLCAVRLPDNSRLWPLHRGAPCKEVVGALTC